MQVVPGNAFLNTVSGAAAAQPAPPQPPAGEQGRVPPQAVQGAGRSDATAGAAQHRSRTRPPQAPQYQGNAGEVRPQRNAPRGSLIDIFV